MNGRTEQTEIKAQNKNAAALPVAAAFLFSLFLAHQILLSLIGQESAALIAEFFAYILFVLSAQAALSWFAKMKNLKAHFIIAGFLTFNVLGLFLSYTAFAGYAPWLRLLVLAALFGFFSALFGFGKRALFIGIVLLGAAANIETGIKTWRKLFPPTVEYGEWRKAFPKKFKEVKFVQKPNVYLISWDALAPPAVLREYLDAPVPEYARYLNNGEFRVFRNAFADRIAYPFPARALHPGHSEGSKTFHNSLLILDPVMWETLPGGLPYYYNGLNFAGQFYYFAGRRPSPLYGIFKDNGYKVLVSYDREYFGEKGPFIDEYLIPKDNAGQCRFKLPWHYFQSLGFCETRRLWAKPNAPATH
ncbi:MAG: hypothetical protein HAW59_02160, partial [Betaproteobacteria bacterium]|nr:hypothetical protein [Betaproteobacteria bacterium]